MSEKTDFGFKKVNKNEKQSLVESIFSNVASKYDLMNDLMSGGAHRLWKNQMLNQIDFDKNKNYKIIDVAGGTGDIAFRIAKKANQNNIKAKINIVDINQEMLDEGKKKAINLNLFNQVNFNRCNGESLDYNENNFDYYTIAFGIRNFTNIDTGLKEAYRVLNKGGKFICLEFSKVNNEILSKVYDTYSFNIIPRVGGLVLNDKDSYQYLVESIRKFPNQEKFKEMIDAAGFKNCSYKSLSFGAVAIHVGYKL
jgi:demethylmenaquinone methyltransferase / 2-methoxy-6-polyprenyl-1,4-benzoquinol methylase